MLEEHICSLILCHLEEFHPLLKSQWGFRAGCSTVTTLLLTIHRWLQLMESGKEICAVFLDYKKAFDSVPHKLLIEKLQLHNNLLAWITDYLTQRKQRVVVKGATSSQALVSSGVPQGSVLSTSVWCTRTWSMPHNCGTPYMQNDIDKLESVQTFALKLVTHQWDANYNCLLKVTDIPRLSERRCI